MRSVRIWAVGMALALLGALLALAAGCGAPGPEASAAPGKVRVVVSLPVFVSLAQAVGGDRVVVTSIVPPGVDAHTFYPRPSTVKAVADADVVFVNGLGLETWLGPLIESAGGSKVPVYALAEGLPTLEAPSEETGGRLEANPHLWLDPTNAERYVERMARALSERDPSGAATYQANARRAEEAIAALDREAQAAIATIPESRRTLVTFHDAYPYFAAHYGLRLVGVVVKSPGREPSSRELTDLVTTIRAQGISAIFVEPQFNPKLADTLAREAGIRTLTLYSDTPPPGQGYLEMMRLNVQHVVEGLR